MIDRLAAEAVGEFTLPGRSEEQSQEHASHHEGHIAERQKLVPHHVGDQPAEYGEIDQVEEQSGGDERKRPPMGAAHRGIVHRFVDETLDGLRHFQRPLLAHGDDASDCTVRLRSGRILWTFPAIRKNSGFRFFVIGSLGINADADNKKMSAAPCGRHQFNRGIRRSALSRSIKRSSASENPKSIRP